MTDAETDPLPVEPMIIGKLLNNPWFLTAIFVVSLAAVGGSEGEVSLEDFGPAIAFGPIVVGVIWAMTGRKGFK